MMIRSVKVRRVGDGESAEPWRAALASPDWLAASTILKEQPGSWVRRATILGRDVVIKCRQLNTPFRRFKAAIGLGQGARHWRWSARLERAGVRTSPALALAHAETEDGPCELLALGYVPGTTLLHILDDIARGRGPSAAEQNALAREAGRMIGALRRRGYHNRDHKPSNIIVTPSGPPEQRLVLIDCVGIELGGDDESRDAAEMLASLVIEPLGCGCPPPRRVWIRTLITVRDLLPPARQNLGRWLVRRVQDIVTKHGDPRPKVNPLSAPHVGDRP